MVKKFDICNKAMKTFDNQTVPCFGVAFEIEKRNHKVKRIKKNSKTSLDVQFK